MSGNLVIVALRDTDHAEDLIKLGCLIASEGEDKIMVLHVIEVPPVLPLDAHDEALDGPAQRLMARASTIAQQQFGKQVMTRIVRARFAGEAIADEAREHKARWLVLGYRHRSRVGEIFFGSTVRHLAEGAPCRLIISINPLLKQ
jgi:nucleotide-binding universal stress UspA family protein